MSTRSGKQLEARVAEMFRAAGYRVRQRTLLDYREIDVMAELDNLSAPLRIAVECKDYSDGPVTVKDLDSFYSKVDEALNERRLDRAMIVTNSHFAPMTRAAAVDRSIDCLLLEELVAKLSDVNAYATKISWEYRARWTTFGSLYRSHRRRSTESKADAVGGHCETLARPPRCKRAPIVRRLRHR